MSNIPESSFVVRPVTVDDTKAYATFSNMPERLHKRAAEYLGMFASNGRMLGLFDRAGALCMQLNVTLKKESGKTTGWLIIHPHRRVPQYGCYEQPEFTRGLSDLIKAAEAVEPGSTNVQVQMDRVEYESGFVSEINAAVTTVLREKFHFGEPKQNDDMLVLKRD